MTNPCGLDSWGFHQGWAWGWFFVGQVGFLVVAGGEVDGRSGGRALLLSGSPERWFPVLACGCPSCSGACSLLKFSVERQCAVRQPFCKTHFLGSLCFSSPAARNPVLLLDALNPVVPVVHDRRREIPNGSCGNVLDSKLDLPYSDVQQLETIPWTAHWQTPKLPTLAPATACPSGDHATK